MAVDRVKRGITGDVIGEKIMNATRPSPRQRALRERMQVGYNDLKEVLERKDWWGKSGKVHEDMNEAWSNVLRTGKDQKKALGKLFDTRNDPTRGVPGFGENVSELSADKLREAIKNPNRRRSGRDAGL
jgi:hypothetical protein